MILDTLANHEQYATLHPGIALALQHLAVTDYSQAEIGRHNIDGDNVFAIVNDYAPRDRTTAPFEIHRDYIDVQFVVSGEEACGCLPLAGRTPDTEYNAQRDFAEFHSAPLLDKANFVTLKAGMFAIFFPEDIHMPGAAPGSEQVRKVVVKVRR